MTDSWLVGDRKAVARERILDAAGRCFARCGVPGTSVGDVAAEAGCSRPTIYRYFEDRDGLRTAFVEREAGRIGEDVAEVIARVDDPGERLVIGIIEALRRVRGNATLSSWFDPTEAGATDQLARASAAINRFVEPFVRTDDAAATRRRTDWVIRAVLSLLTSPGASDDDEETMLRELLVPVVVSASIPPAE